MKEKDIQAIFNKKNDVWGVFELKLCKGKSIRFDAVQDHQMEALKKISGEIGLVHKLTDPPIFGKMKTRFNVKRPFDCFKLRHIRAYIVICFYKARQYKRCYYILPQDWKTAQRISSKKSITEGECSYRSRYIREL